MSAIPQGAIRLPLTAVVLVLDPTLGPSSRSIVELRVGDEVLVEAGDVMCFRPITSLAAVAAPRRVTFIPIGAFGAGAQAAGLVVDARQPVGPGHANAALQAAQSQFGVTTSLDSCDWSLIAVDGAARMIVDQMGLATGPLHTFRSLSGGVLQWVDDPDLAMHAYAGGLALTTDDVVLLPERAAFRFSIPPQTSVVRLVSGRTASAADSRQLGVAVQSIALDGNEIPLDSPSLVRGLHPLERADGVAWRWTDGDALLLLPTLPHPSHLVVEIADWHTRL